jgi:hypothetical protein
MRQRAQAQVFRQVLEEFVHGSEMLLAPPVAASSRPILHARSASDQPFTWRRRNSERASRAGDCVHDRRAQTDEAGRGADAPMTASMIVGLRPTKLDVVPIPA